MILVLKKLIRSPSLLSPMWQKLPYICNNFFYYNNLSIIFLNYRIIKKSPSIGFDSRLDQILVLASKFVNIKIHILSCAPRQTLFKFFDCWIQKLTWPHSTCTVTVSCRARPWASQPNFHLDSLMVQTFYTMMLSSGINYRMNQI